MFKLEVVGKPEEKINKFFEELCKQEKLKKLGYELCYTKENDKFYFYCIGSKDIINIGLKMTKGTLIKAIREQLKKIGCDVEVKEVKI